MPARLSASFLRQQATRHSRGETTLKAYRTKRGKALDNILVMHEPINGCGSAQIHAAKTETDNLQNPPAAASVRRLLTPKRIVVLVVLLIAVALMSLLASAR